MSSLVHKKKGDTSLTHPIMKKKRAMRLPRRQHRHLLFSLFLLCLKKKAKPTRTKETLPPLSRPPFHSPPHFSAAVGMKLEPTFLLLLLPVWRQRKAGGGGSGDALRNRRQSRGKKEELFVVRAAYGVYLWV